MSRGGFSIVDELRRQVSFYLSNQKVTATAAGNGLPSFGLEIKGTQASIGRGARLLHRQFHQSR